MRPMLLRAWAALALLVAAIPAHAVSPVPVIMGPSRDGDLHDLQHKVDRLVGFGRIDVSRDFVGAHPGDPDPFCWVNRGTRDVVVQVLDCKTRHMVIGWYDESGGRPVIDGIDDGLIINDWRSRRTRGVVRVPANVTRYGFFVDSDEEDSRDSNHSGRYRFFTNRLFNTPGFLGRGAEHAPFDGDPQFLIYDVSPWLGPDTWLVACEYSDSGRRVGFGNDDSDNDYADILFLVGGVGVTPTRATTFSSVKALFR